MRSHFRGLLALSSAAVALCSVGPAFAQAADAEVQASDEIVVTAQKREERLLDVPVSVTAVDAGALAEQNLVRLSDYYARVPSLQLVGNRVSQLSLRGITTGGGTNPTLAITIDDVPFGGSLYIAQPPIPDLDPSDLQRIEVLRGPQGTLYGASSLGGLIKFVTTEPDTHDFSGRLEAGAVGIADGGSGQSYRGSVNIPVIDDRVAVRLSAFTREDPGYVDNVHPSVNRHDTNSSTYEGWRGSVLLRPTDNLTVNLAAMNQTIALDDFATVRVTADLEPFIDDLTRSATLSTTEREFTLYSARADLDLGAVTLSSVSGWGESLGADDQDVTIPFLAILSNPAAYGAQPAGTTVRIINADEDQKFTQELRLSSNGDGPLQWTGGIFYNDEEFNLQQQTALVAPNGSLVAHPTDTNTPGTFEERAVFADVTYAFTPKFDVQIGARYSENDQHYDSVAVVDPVAAPLFGPSSSVPQDFSEESTTWLFTPRYRISDDAMVFLRVATGYRPGSANSNLLGIPSSFDSDTVTSYELGFKGYVLDRALQLEASVFQTDWEDIQLTNATASQVNFFTNGGAAQSRGVEVAARWTPWSGMAISSNATWLDAELTEDLAPPPPGGSGLVGEDGDRLPYSAEFQFNLSAQQDWELGGGFSAFVGASYSYLGDRAGVFNSTLAPGSRPRVEVPSYDTVDLRTGVYNDNWRLAIYARNVGDERGIVNVTNNNGTSGTYQAIYIQPLTFGASLAFEF